LISAIVSFFTQSFGEEPSSFIYYVGPGVFSEAVYHDKTVFDVLELTPIVWGWMFGVGILVAKYYYLLEKYFKYFFIFGLMCIFLLFLQLPGFESSGNRLGVGYYFVYVGFILWIAFCLPSIRLGGDISYGVYIWHMPVVNLLLVLGFDCPVFAITLTLFFAIISWVVVEKPALKFKHHTLRRV